MQNAVNEKYLGMNTMKLVYEENVVAHCGILFFRSLQEKCHQYWPAERSARYQYFVVDPMAEYNMPQYILREFKVTDARVSRHCCIQQSCENNMWSGVLLKPTTGSWRTQNGSAVGHKQKQFFLQSSLLL